MARPTLSDKMSAALGQLVGAIEELTGQRDRLRAAVETQQDALWACTRYLLGTGPQPDPEKIGAAIAAGEAALTKAAPHG